MAGDRDLLRGEHGEHREGNSRPGNAAIGDDFLVLILVVAPVKEVQFGTVNSWRRWECLKATMASCEE